MVVLRSALSRLPLLAALTVAGCAGYGPSEYASYGYSAYDGGYGLPDYGQSYAYAPYAGGYYGEPYGVQPYVGGYGGVGVFGFGDWRGRDHDWDDRNWHPGHGWNEWRHHGVHGERKGIAGGFARPGSTFGASNQHAAAPHVAIATPHGAPVPGHRS